MIKKIIALFGTLILLTASLFGCSDLQMRSGTLDQLNTLLAQEPLKMQLTVTTVQKGEELVSTYEVTKQTNSSVTVTYAIQSFSVFFIGEIPVSPEGRIKTERGTAVVSNGEVLSDSGEALPADLPYTTSVEIQLSKDNLTNLKNEDGIFTAQVSSPQKLLGKKVNATEMTLAISYTETAVQTLTLTYTVSEDVTTTLVYRFE